jgi:putative membrane protein
MPVAPRAECVALLDHVLGSSAASVSTIPLTPPPSRAKWLAPLTFWWLAFGLDDRMVVSRRGFLARRLDVVPLARVQSVRLQQGPLQRRFGLVDLEVDSPPGPVRVRGHHRDGLEARERGGEVVLAGRAARRAGWSPSSPSTSPFL